MKFKNTNCHPRSNLHPLGVCIPHTKNKVKFEHAVGIHAPLAEDHNTVGLWKKQTGKSNQIDVDIQRNVHHAFPSLLLHGWDKLFERDIEKRMKWQIYFPYVALIRLITCTTN